MARIPADELERLKREISLERLVRAHGVELRRHGKDLLGSCPFHDDREPSLVISPQKNLWHCLGACRSGGSVIDWVMKAEGVSFRHAVEILRHGSPEPSSLSGRSGPPPKRSEARKLPSALVADAGERELLARVVGIYHETLLESPEALAYLERRGIGSREAIERFRLGYSNRTLGYRLPGRKRKDGERLRARLQALGILRSSGHEHLSGSLVVPVLGEGGEVVEIYGRKIGDRLRKGTPLHLYLPGPHRGVWNVASLRGAREAIVCESLIDALSFWVCGYRAVTAAYGINGFTEEHEEALVSCGIERVLIAYDRDEAGDRSAAVLAERLQARGLGCYRVRFPKGMDANEVAVQMTPAAKSLGLALRGAEWMGEGPEPVAVSLQAASPDRRSVARESDPGAAREEEEERVGPRALLGAPVDAPAASAPAPSSPAPSPPLAAASSREAPGELSPPPPPPVERLPRPEPPPAEVPVEVRPEEVVVRLGDRRYRVRGLGKNLSFDVLKINLLVGCGEAFHVDVLDLYSARQRTAFLKAASRELKLDEALLRSDLGRVLLELEALQERLIRETLEPKRPEPVRLSERERGEALALLRSPDLLERILGDFERCGLVGERTNKLTAYLAAVSRKLEEPLAVIVQSSSAAGKSALMEAVLALVPEEDRVHYSAMTGQSLFYMGEADLRHKILAIAEEEGAERASYALKLLQSEGELTIASTGKDPQSGRLVTHEYRVEGPVMIFLTTTAVEVDEELLNRCLVLSVDEGREQTRAIHRLQRAKRTLEGLRAQSERSRIEQLHRNAQRLLEPLRVLNPWAEQLTFLDTQTRMRRDHEKYLTLIDAITLLHQHQRTVKEDATAGRYVVVELADIARANRIAHEVLGRCLDELPPQTRRLLGELEELVRVESTRVGCARSEVLFTRRFVRERLGWGDTQLRVHLERLVELEYLLVHQGGRGRSFVYELIYESGEGSWRLPGLIDPEAIATGQRRTNGGYDDALAGQEGDLAGSSRPRRGGIAGPSRDALERGEAGVCGRSGAECAEEAHRGHHAARASYPQVPPDAESSGAESSGAGSSGTDAAAAG